MKKFKATALLAVTVYLYAFAFTSVIAHAQSLGGEFRTLPASAAGPYIRVSSFLAQVALLSRQQTAETLGEIMSSYGIPEEASLREDFLAMAIEFDERYEDTISLALFSLDALPEEEALAEWLGNKLGRWLERLKGEFGINPSYFLRQTMYSSRFSVTITTNDSAERESRLDSKAAHLRGKFRRSMQQNMRKLPGEMGR